MEVLDIRGGNCEQSPLRLMLMTGGIMGLAAMRSFSSSASCRRLALARRFWNQIFTCRQTIQTCVQISFASHKHQQFCPKPAASLCKRHSFTCVPATAGAHVKLCLLLHRSALLILSESGSIAGQIPNIGSNVISHTNTKYLFHDIMAHKSKRLLTHKPNVQSMFLIPE